MDNSLDDKKLFESLGQYQDREALIVFLNRYGKACYSLAFVILGNAEAAQEAVADTMAQAVQTAQVASPPANLKAWLLKSTARTSLAISKRRHSEFNGNDDSSYQDGILDPNEMAREGSSATLESV